MEGECMKLLPKVCKVLAVSEKSLPDDTSLEKLLDWFSGLTNTGKCLLEVCPCLPEFISTVIHNTAPDPSILSFTFKLTGLLAATESSFTALQKDFMLLGLVFNPPHHWQEAGLWDDPCVRIGWVLGMKAMFQHLPALHFLVETGLTKVLLQLQTDTSLFVAAAANDMLAHLLVSHSQWSENCGDRQRKEMTGRMEEDRQRLTLTLGIIKDYRTVTMAILEHVKGSLVSKESKECHQTLQALRLLILVLSQVRAPLLGILLKALSEPLEALVAEGHSQLHLLLLDVLLTAYSRTSRDNPTPGRHNPAPNPHPGNPDSGQPASALISRMLDTYKPPELIHTAAALLRRDHRDLSHKAKAAGLVLLPLEMITGRTVPGSQSAGSAEQRSSLAELMTSKTASMSLLCVCLTHATLLTCTSPDVLPCPIGSLVTVILSLLRLCSGQAPSSPVGCAKACRNLIGCGKVQRCSLDALAALAVSPGAAERMREVFSVLIEYLDNPDSEPTVLHKSYQATLKWISVCPDPSSSMRDQLGHDLLMAVRKRVCDMRWEVRDSTVEFLGELAAMSLAQESARGASEDSLGCSFIPHLMEALQDPESYVRASAITALAQAFTVSWQQGAAPGPEQTALVNRLLEILSGDTEAFPRRAVVRYFTSWFSLWTQNAPEPPSSSSSSLPLLTSSVGSALSLGSADLDWEVKVHTLELAGLLLCRALPPRGQQEPAGVLAELVERGVVWALLSGLVDCDRPVALKACGLLMTLRDAVCPPPTGGADRASLAPGTTAVAAVTCEPQQGRAWGREVEALLRGAGVDADGGKGARSKSRDWTREEEEAEDAEAEEEAGATTRVGVCDVLRSLDLDERLAVLTQSSDHVQNSPLSLLQDILSIGDTRADPNTQEVIVDCY